MATKRKPSVKKTNKKISQETVFSKLEKTISKQAIDKLADLSIVQESDGSYLLFNKYSIKKIDNEYRVSHTYLAESNISFYVLKHAVTWCTYDKRNRIMESKRIQDLDRQLTSIESAIEIHQRLARKTTNLDSKLIYLAKLGEEKLQRTQINAEIEQYVSESKNWQANRFNAKP
jgi:hypothetical protein